MYKNTRTTVLLPLLIAAGVVAGLLIGRYAGSGAVTTHYPEGSSLNNKITQTLSMIESSYVDRVNLDSLSEHVLPTLVESLDPHSVYIPASEVEQANDKLQSQFDGIGVVFNMATDTVIVLNVMAGGPSEKAGVKSGDRIIKINDTLVAGQKMDQQAVVRKLRGPRGTKVSLSLERIGIKQPVPVTVTRDVIRQKSYDAAFMIRPGVGYFKLSAFARDSYRDMMEALEKLQAQGMQSLIFDLRDNTGGYMDQATLMANEFLPDGDLIVYTLDRARRRVDERSKGGRFTQLPITLLIDEVSASSSEILAGAIQDNDRGTIIGRRSFGKGLVQMTMEYPDRSMLLLTVARYYTPSGRSIQKPYNHGTKEYMKDLENRYLHNEVFSADSIHFADSLKFKTRAGRTVYGGGGIMPDIFVPMDTTDVTRYLFEVVGRNILYRYTLDYSDRHRQQLDRIKTLGELNAMLDADRTLVEDFVSYAAARGVAPNRAQIEISRKLITAQLRGYIGRNTPLEDVGFYANTYTTDPVIMAAIKELEKNKLKK